MATIEHQGSDIASRLGCLDGDLAPDSLWQTLCPRERRSVCHKSWPRGLGQSS